MTTGVCPAGFAAACRYTAGREASRRVTQAEAADAASAATTTVRSHRDTVEEQIA